MMVEARGYANRVEKKTAKSGVKYQTFSLGVKQVKKAYGNNPEQTTWANFMVTDFTVVDIPDKAYVTVKGYLTVREYEKDGKARTALEVKTSEAPVVAPPLAQADGPATTPKPSGSKDPWDE